MALLRVNNLDVPVREGSLVRSPEQSGAGVRALSGALRPGEAAKRRFEFSLPWRSVLESRAWFGLLTGQGHVWSWDTHLYSSKGLAPNAGFDATVDDGDPNPPAPKYGDGRVTTVAALVYTTNFGSDWTVAFWRWSTDVWVHYVLRSDGAKWVNGARNDGATTSFITISATTVTFGAANSFDDAAAFPFKFPDEWPPQFYAAGVAVGSLPKLAITGDLVGAQATFLAEVPKVAVATATLDGVVQQDLESLTVVLREV